MERTLDLIERKVQEIDDPEIRQTAAAYLKMLRGQDVDLSEIPDPLERLHIATVIEKELSEEDISEFLSAVSKVRSLRLRASYYRELSGYFRSIEDPRADHFADLADSLEKESDRKNRELQILKKLMIYLDRSL